MRTSCKKWKLKNNYGGKYFRTFWHKNQYNNFFSDAFGIGSKENWPEQIGAELISKKQVDSKKHIYYKLISCTKSIVLLKVSSK